MPKIIPPRKHSYSKLEPILIKSSIAEDVKFSETKMTVHLKDGRELSVPLTWFPRLKSATGTALENWLFIGGGEGIHWEALDEDLLVENLFWGVCRLWMLYKIFTRLRMVLDIEDACSIFYALVGISSGAVDFVGSRFLGGRKSLGNAFWWVRLCESLTFCIAVFYCFLNKKKIGLFVYICCS